MKTAEERRKCPVPELKTAAAADIDQGSESWAEKSSSGGWTYLIQFLIPEHAQCQKIRASKEEEKVEMENDCSKK